MLFWAQYKQSQDYIFVCQNVFIWIVLLQEGMDITQAIDWYYNFFRALKNLDGFVGE